MQVRARRNDPTSSPLPTIGYSQDGTRGRGPVGNDRDVGTDTNGDSGNDSDEQALAEELASEAEGVEPDERNSAMTTRPISPLGQGKCFRSTMTLRFNIDRRQPSGRLAAWTHSLLRRTLPSRTYVFQTP